MSVYRKLDVLRQQIRKLEEDFTETQDPDIYQELEELREDFEYLWEVREWVLGKRSQPSY